MRWFFYDDVPTGHHMGYLTGITGAAQRLGLEPIAASPKRPRGLPAESWITTRTRSHRNVLANRRQLARVAGVARSWGADTFVDLFLDKNAWAASAALEKIPTRLHVVHHAIQYDVSQRRGAALLRTRVLQRRVQRLARRGARIVAHTKRAAEIMAPWLPIGTVATIGYPIDLVDPVTIPTDEPPRFLFVGAARPEKGLDLLLKAIPRRWDATLMVMGRQPDGFRQRFGASSSGTVEWVDEFVDDEVLAAGYRSTSAVIIPYRSEFGHHGGPSSVLLEALSYGLPVLTTRALQDQLPTGYGGAIVVDSDDPDSLAEGLERISADLERVAKAARMEGPPFVAANHTYDSYVEGLIAHGTRDPIR
jgi:glycosyltransferase involved in cell wall biosynthesis